MDRRTLTVLAVALLAVLALGIGAATIDSAVPADGDGLGNGGTDGIFGESDAGDPDADEDAEGGAQPAFQIVPCIEELFEPWAIAIALGVVGLLALVVYWDTRSLFATVVVPLLVVAILGPFYVVLGMCGSFPELVISPPTQEPGAGDPTIIDLGGGDGNGDEESGTSVPVPTIVFGFVLIFALAASALLLFAAGTTRDGESATEEASPPPDREDASVEAIAKSAGEAADRLEGDVDVDNEIYRAWAEMTTHLEVESPESSTPAEFAAAAVETGMAREDVEELTRLFEDVRYGGAEPTEKREKRAIAALRRIETTYSDGKKRP